MSRLRWACAVALIAVACDKTQKTPVAPNATLPKASAVPTGPIQLEVGSAVVKTDPRGGRVIATGGSGVASIELADDTVGTWLEEDDVNFEIGGQRVRVPEGNLLEIVGTSPDGAFAVALPNHSECTDICTWGSWLLHGPSQRWELTPGVYHRDFAWHPASTVLAFGSEQGLLVVELPSATITRFEAYTAPAYAADGTLYVRGLEDWHVYKLVDGKATRVATGKRPTPYDVELHHPQPVKLAPDGTMTVPSYE